MDRRALFHISYGLYVITSVRDSDKNGFIGNTVFQITSKPPQVALGVSVDNYTHDFIHSSGLFNISVLNRNVSPEIIQIFGYTSGRDSDKFVRTDWKSGSNGAPLITDGVNAFFECRVTNEISMGTHSVFIGEVTDAETLPSESVPLTYEYYRETMKGKAPKNAPTYVEEPVSGDNATLSGDKYICSVCNYEYDPALGDPEHGIPPGTPFTDLPDDWKCPVCASPKEVFNPQ